MEGGQQQAIFCKGVTKSYRSKTMVTPALRGIDLSIKQGELFMLVGPSGCGKTTLISVIAGILDHDGGDCLIFGSDLQSMNDDQRTAYRGKNVGFVFQSYNLIPTLTTAENVAIPLLLAGVTRADANQRAKDILARVGLSDKIGVLPTELSGGQQQRVAIARALIHNPRLIVCDEPTSALDHSTGAEIMQIFRDEAMRGERTLVIVTHDSRIFQYADRIGVMDDGLITKIASSPEEL
ncbi:MAG: ABC transporter ATP-binding protein [Pseudomonadota bacterium]